MRRLRLFGYLGWTLLVFAGAPTVADLKVTVSDWGTGEPMLTLDPDGSGLLMLLDPLAPNLDASISLRAAEVRNPGLLVSFGTHVVDDWVAQGLVRLRPDGSVRIMSQQQLDELNALLRARVTAEIRPYLQIVEQALAADSDAVDSLRWNLHVATLEIPTLPPIDADWYIQERAEDITETTECEPCNDPDGSVYCPSQCVEGCEPPATNCVHVEVTPWIPRARAASIVVTSR